MEKKHFELLLRGTPFGLTLLLEIWDDLNTMQRIDFLLHQVEQSSVVPTELIFKAIDDPNPVVRMFAVYKSYISEEENPELYAKLINDTSPLVRAARNSNKLMFEEKDLIALDHTGRLGVIALADYHYSNVFVQFITNGLQNNSLSEDEAAELVTEFVSNPKILSSTTEEPSDGQDWYYQGECFKAIWSLTNTTPPNVHSQIVWKYPIKTEGGLGHKIPEELIDGMSESALYALARRQQEYLLKKLEETPDKYDKKIHEAALDGSDEPGFIKKNAYSEIEELRRELEQFRDEMRESLNILTEHLHTESTRKCGLFG